MSRQEVFDWCRQRYRAVSDYQCNGWNAALRYEDNNTRYGIIIELVGS
ncbi:MAG: hypothetical protein PUJ55_15985 [Clostridiales bacterium]|nr:hypothetical protein [Clostridiales bacterium]MDY4111563.1 hypothetical protein [Roseburia sp.]